MKFRKITCLLAGSITAAVMAFSGLEVQAAPVTMPDGETFDAEYYAEHNPDVVAVLGTDPTTLYQHYVLCGKAEGRLPYDNSSFISFQQALAQKTLSTFAFYSFHNWTFEDPIVLSSPGEPMHVHDLASGRYSSFSARGSLNVDESYFFDYARYAAEYPEVAAAVGTTKQALWQHYKTYGVYNGYYAYSTSTYGNAKLYCIYILPSIIANAATPRDQIKAVHDWLISRTDYDMDNYQRGTIPEESFHITGTIHNGAAVCQGYAETFDYFMYLLGIECSVASSYNHAWDLVTVDGQNLVVDVTWDDHNYSKGWAIPEYDYFLITEEEAMRIDRRGCHIPEDYTRFYQ